MPERTRIPSEIFREALQEQVIASMVDALRNAKGIGPNNFKRVRRDLDKTFVDEWLQDPSMRLMRRVPDYFKGYAFDPTARLIIGASDPWYDTTTSSRYLGCIFAQVRVIPQEFESGAVVYSLVFHSLDGSIYKDKGRCSAYEEIPILSQLPSYSSIIPRRFTSDPIPHIPVLRGFDTFLNNARRVVKK